MISEFSRFDIDWVSGKIQSPVFPKKSVHLQKNSEGLKGALAEAAFTMTDPRFED